MVVSRAPYNNRPAAPLGHDNDDRLHFPLRSADPRPGLWAAGARRLRVGRQLADHEDGAAPYHAAVVRGGALLDGVALPVRAAGRAGPAGPAVAARPAGVAERGLDADGAVPADREFRPQPC